MNQISPTGKKINFIDEPLILDVRFHNVKRGLMDFLILFFFFSIYPKTHPQFFLKFFNTYNWEI